MYQVQWASTGKAKWVKRLNLFFENESRTGFRFRLRQARRRRDEVGHPGGLMAQRAGAG